MKALMTKNDIEDWWNQWEKVENKRFHKSFGKMRRIWNLYVFLLACSITGFIIVLINLLP